MGTKNLTPIVPAITGAALTKTDSGGTTSSFYVVASTAQSMLDFSRMAVVIENYSSTASVVVTPKAGDTYSDVIRGDATAITVATGASIILGGKLLESARFKNSDGYFEFTVTTAGTVYAYCVMFPFVIPNQ